ncbi:MAG: D-glycero-beta-D-manno-heptose 1,7-bisphosphate 7-phosphatase [Methylophilaceae bacterium]
MTGSPALFLDRDGVINIDKGYVHKAEDCEFVDGIFDLVKRANQLGYKVFVVTNQAGIARGYYTEEQFLSFSEWMKNEFQKHQAHIDEIYFCPHHPVYGLEAYHISCDCRKPAPGMFLKAQAAFNIDMSRSIMIGDNLSDLEAAHAANVERRYLFIWSHEKNSTPENMPTKSDNISLKVITSLNEVELAFI